MGENLLVALLVGTVGGDISCGSCCWCELKHEEVIVADGGGGWHASVTGSR